jgi:Putative 2/3 transmembrane domain holin
MFTTLFDKFPRMLLWALLTIVLIGMALYAQSTYPGNIFAVTLYKAHLMALGGWGGYWLDRALFPYARPHEALTASVQYPNDRSASLANAQLGFFSMLRRAIIVAACLVCVGLGA